MTSLLAAVYISIDYLISGVTVVIMIDGYSRMILGHSVMRLKNNIIIYDEVYRLVNRSSLIAVLGLLGYMGVYVVI